MNNKTNEEKYEIYKNQVIESFGADAKLVSYKTFLKDLQSEDKILLGAIS